MSAWSESDALKTADSPDDPRLVTLSGSRPGLLRCRTHGGDGTKRGAPMRSSHPQPALAHYRAAVTELITEGESIGGAIEEAIDGRRAT